jgi:hypothetical protein
MQFTIILAAAAAAAQAAAPQAQVDAAAARAAGYAQGQAALTGGSAGYASASQPRAQAAGAAPQAVMVSSRAFDGLQVQPVPDAGANVRFYKGVPSVDRHDESAAIQVTPMGLDHGRLTFAVSVLNLSDSPDNFGIENVSVMVGSQSIPVLSRDRLDRMASNRAHWKQFGMAMLGGLAAASAASSRDTYHATTFTPSGVYSTTISAPSIGGQIAASHISDDTAYAISSIQARLDATRDALDNDILQTTTVMPEDGYAARFVIDKFKGSWPQTVHLVMTFAGKQYPFDFQVSKQH